MDGYLHLPSNTRLTLKTDAEGQPSTHAAVFLDRDGVLVEDVHFLRQVSQLRVLPGVPDGLRALQSQFYLVVVTNQSGIARGLFTEEELYSIHSALISQLSDEGVVVDALYYCPHLPEAVVKAYSQNCGCRKPKPGMLLKAKEQWGIDLVKSYMIGDRPSDIEAGQRAGVRCISLGEPAGTPHPEEQISPDFARAADNILAGPPTASVT